MQRKLALLIGNGQYEKLPPLTKYKADVNTFAQTLHASNIGAFDKVKEILDVPTETIRQEIELFFKESKRDDLLLLYLSGHGEMDEYLKQWYFAGIDTDKDNLRMTGVSANFIHESMDDNINLKRIIIVIDTCYASAFFRGAKGSVDVPKVATKQLAGLGRAILAAASLGELAWEDNPSLPLSNFTYYLVQGLTTGDADRDKNGITTVDEWFEYADEHVRNVTSNKNPQTPRKLVDLQKGTFPIAYNPTWQREDAENLHQLLMNESSFPTPILSEEQHSESTFIKEDTPNTFHVGRQKINLIILARGSYGPQKIHCFYERKEHLPRNLEAMRKQYERENKAQKAKGILNLPYNSPMYKLREFDLGHRTIIDGEEVPNLILKFSQTDYFSQIVTDLNINNSVRNRYLANADPITELPIPEFSTILGVNLNVITADNYLVITERSRHANVAGGRLHTSVGENLLRPKDSGVSWAPDPFLALSRGAQEELGLTLNKEKIVFRTFTVIPDFCQYSLIATLRVPQTRSQIDEIWHNVIPADKWESRRLLFYPHNPHSIAQFVVSTWERWFHVALAAVVLSLWDIGYTAKEVDTAFLEARSKLSSL